jgi:hypothetical protein
VDFDDEAEETVFESTGQMMTLETTLDETGENITFCLTPTVMDYDDTETIAMFGVEFTNNVPYEGRDTTSVNGIFFRGDYADSVWTWELHENKNDASAPVDNVTRLRASNFWSLADEPTYACSDGQCYGDMCATRATAASGSLFELPLGEDVNFIAYFWAGTF